MRQNEQAHTGPHHTLSSDWGSTTTRLSLGERPVLAPERTDRAPVEVRNVPCSRRSAASMSTDGEALWMISALQCLMSSSLAKTCVHAHPAEARLCELSNRHHV